MTEANVKTSINESNSINNNFLNKNVVQENIAKQEKENVNITDIAEETSQTQPKFYNNVKCDENSSLPVNSINNSGEKIQSQNENKNNTVLKYVYKNSHKQSPAEKQNGHYKNSLQRGKRSQEETLLDNINKVPANFEYTTIHNPKEREDLQNWQTIPAVINSANLADFNIETLHTNKEDNINLQNSSPYPLQSSTSRQSEESSDSRETDRSEEQNETTFSGRNLPSRASQRPNNSDESSEIIDNLDITPLTSDLHDTNRESIKEYPKTNIKDESSEVRDVENYHSSEDTPENTTYHAKLKSNSGSESSEDSSESTENKENIPYDSRENENLNLNATIHDTQEKKLYNDSDGKIDHEQNQNLNEYIPTESSLYINPKDSHDKPEKISVDPDRSAESDSYFNKKQISINDEEVRPVIELNSESSEESNEESQEDAKSKLTNAHNEKDLNIFLDNAKDGDKANVKQQFERIPLNYNHDENKTSSTKVNDPEENTALENDETIATTVKYDDNLNFKFSDVKITLPEIKLPEDILDYATESASVSENDEENDDFLPYKNKEHSQENSEEKSNEKVPTYYGDYSSFIKNDFKNAKSRQNSKRNDYDDEDEDREVDDDNNEDLYEKFVRERFGKRGSFQKRSEKLVKADPIVENRKLYKTLQNVLKKTQEIQKEADKNGKPKADYLWTLEYGQKLH